MLQVVLKNKNVFTQPHFLKPSHSSYLSAYDDGTDSVFWNVSI